MLTPLEPAPAQRPAKPIAVVAILRAGLGMVDGFLRLVPEAAIGHLGMRRNEETLQPEAYYESLPGRHRRGDRVRRRPDARHRRLGRSRRSRGCVRPAPATCAWSAWSPRQRASSTSAPFCPTCPNRRRGAGSPARRAAATSGRGSATRGSPLRHRMSRADRSPVRSRRHAGRLATGDRRCPERHAARARRAGAPRGRAGPPDRPADPRDLGLAAGPRVDAVDDVVRPTATATPDPDARRHAGVPRRRAPARAADAPTVTCWPSRPPRRSRPRSRSSSTSASTVTSRRSAARYRPPTEGKAVTVGRALEALGLATGTGAVLVGDREHDVHGGHAHGLRVIGAAWGYGNPGELQEAGAEAIAAAPSGSRRCSPDAHPPALTPLRPAARGTARSAR